MARRKARRKNPVGRPYSERDRDEIERRDFDQHGLSHLLDAMQGICLAKAEHVMTTYSDKGLSRLWIRWAEQFGKLSAKADKDGL